MNVRLFAVLFVLVLGATALAAPPMSSHIYGVHNWADGLGTDLKNSKGFYTVDMVTSSQWVSDANYRQGYTNTVATAAAQGFTVILRIDYQPCVVTPAENDEDGLREFGQRCHDIVDALKDYCRIWVIGNEMQAGYCPVQIPPVWYAEVLSRDDEGVYDQIHAAQSDAIVTFGGLGGWPGFDHESGSGVNYIRTFCQNVGDKVDAFSVHAYNGPANQALGGSLDDPRTSDAGSFGAFRTYSRVIYEYFQDTRPVYITEWNSYWWIANPAPHSEESYEAGNIQKAYEAIDLWNRSNDLKVRTLAWYSYAHYGVCSGEFGDFYENAIQPNRCTPAPRLVQAHDDFAWTTANTDYRWDAYGDGRLLVEAENYENTRLWGDTADTGVPGTDYADTTPTNIGGVWRPYDQVDIGMEGGVVFVGWTEAGEWLRYVVCGGKAGSYRLELRHASWNPGNRQVRVTFDGVNLTGDIALPSTGDWYDFATTATEPFALQNKVHEIRLQFVDGGVNIDSFALVPVGRPQVTADTLAIR